MNRIFVYGTLMRGMENHHLLQPFTLGCRSGYISGGELYHLEYGYPALTIVKTHSKPVHGEIVELQHVDQATQVLDRLEEYHGRGNPNNLYERVIMPAADERGSVNAYVYVWARPEQLPDIGQLVPDGCWRSFIKLRNFTP